jgi:hypothetical protein
MGELRDIWEREDAKEARQKEPSDLQLYGKTQLYYSIFMLSFLAPPPVQAGDESLGRSCQGMQPGGEIAAPERYR